MLAQRERETLAELIPAIRQMDETQSYLEFNASSLHDYLVKEVGYSSTSACRRIDVARLSKRVPALIGKLESGVISLNQISLVKIALRKASKGRAIPAKETQDLFAKLEGKNDYDSQKTVAQFFDLPVIAMTKKAVQRDESVRIEVTLSKEQYAQLTRAQELLSHSVPSKDLVDFLDYVTAKIIDQKTKVARQSRAPEQVTTATAVDRPAARPTKSIAAGDRREILKNPTGCNHRYKDGSTCSSRWQLQSDHVQPKWAGGTNERANLQPLCAKHNRLKYRRRGWDSVVAALTGVASLVKRSLDPRLQRWRRPMRA